MIKKLKILFVFLLSLFIIAKPSYASSSYVLPYPSTMPGNVFYKIHLVEEALLKYWYFGNFGQFTYNLKESDKYLVEAKTLFEYNQYLLGYQALEKSDTYFSRTLPYLLKAQNEGKDISANRQLLSQAALKHQQTLLTMESVSPAGF